MPRIILRFTADRDQRARLHTGIVYGNIHVPHGTVTDGLSVPWFIGWLFARFGRYLLFGILHDHLYHTQVSHTRKEADQLFYTGIRSIGCGYIKARIAYGSLRLFGWIAWNKHSRFVNLK